MTLLRDWVDCGARLVAHHKAHKMPDPLRGQITAELHRDFDFRLRLGFPLADFEVRK